MTGFFSQLYEHTWLKSVDKVKDERLQLKWASMKTGQRCIVWEKWWEGERRKEVCVGDTREIVSSFYSEQETSNYKRPLCDLIIFCPAKKINK